MAVPSDNELIDRTVAGDSHAFDELVRRYQDRLIHSLEQSLGSRDDALEAAQQAFVSAWKKLSGFRRDSAFYSWLYRIALNAAATTRRRKRVPSVSLDQLQESGHTAENGPSDTDPAGGMLAEERVQLVRQALSQIAEEFRQPLVLREIDGLSYDEISEVLSIPAGTVRSRIFRARQELCERLQRQLADEA